MLGNWHQLWEIVVVCGQRAHRGASIPVAVLHLVRLSARRFANDRLIDKLEADPAAAKTAYIAKTHAHNPKWEREVHTWPYLMRVEFVAAVLVTALLMVWSLTLSA